MKKTVRKFEGMVEPFGNGFTVFADGDEVYFETKEEAELFAESMFEESKEV